MSPESGASRLFWTVDEDGERVHRLQSEWDGNKGPWKQRSGYRSEADYDDLSVGVSWSRWGLGVEVDWHRYTAWIGGASVPYRNQSATVTLGPWYLSWTRARPADGAA